jgi:Mrp family chromosome partitioning ATPase
MLNKDQITDNLNEIPVPGVMRGIALMNLISNININDKKLEIELAGAALSPASQEWLKAQIEMKFKKNSEVDEIQVSFIDALPKDLNRIKTVIAVMSGKGGVGKSLVTSLAAVSLKRQGYEVGILDADITGPSIPRMFGITDRPSGAENGILPVTSKSGIEIMSINLLLPNEDDAVIWRGPLIGKAITQFL